MKKSTSVSATLFFTLALLTQSVWATTSIRAEVNGMVCAFCAKGISKKLSKLPQSKEVFVDLKSKVVLIELKDQQTLALQEVNNIIKEAGYDVTKSEYVEKSLGEIKSDLNTNKTKATEGAKP